MAKNKQHEGSLASEPSAEPEPQIDGDSLEEAIAKLTPEQAEMFMRALTLTMKKRRLMLTGTLLALFLLVAGTLWAFVAFTNREPGSFKIWVFLVPFAAAGFSMWLFGRLAKRAGVQTQSTLTSSISTSAASPPL